MRPDFKIRGTCESCFKKKWFIRKRSVPFPGSQTLIARSHKLFCGSCYKKLLEMLNKNTLVK